MNASTRTMQYDDVQAIEGLDAADEALRERALTDLVARMFDGEEYPENVHRGQQINQLDILIECDQAELAEAVSQFLVGRDDDCFRDQIEKIVRNYLSDSTWHEVRMAEMDAEDK